MSAGVAGLRQVATLGADLVRSSPTDTLAAPQVPELIVQRLLL